MKGSVIVTGGGTGGHLKVAKAFTEEVYERGTKPIFIGSKNGQDKEWFTGDYKIKKALYLDTKGVVNKDFKGKMKSLWEIFQEMLHCMDVIERTNTKTVISVGGYSAAPAVFAAILKPGVKLYIHEQNSRMGKLNEITARFAEHIFSSYDPTSKVRDYPVEPTFFEHGRIRKEIKTVIFLGGSQGAKAINDYALKMAKYLSNSGFAIIHQTGRDDFERVSAEYEKMGIEADVFDFSKDLVKKMYKADFAISRAGASTLWELTACSLPTLFIPYPNAAKDHQYYNAKFLKDKGLCFLMREEALNPKILMKCLECDVSAMSRGLASEISEGGVKKMVDYISYVNEKQ